MKTSFLKTAVFVCFGLISALSLFGQSNVIDSLTQELQKTTFDTLRVDIYNELAWLKKGDDPASAFEDAETAYRLAETIGYKKGIADAKSRLGVLYKNEGNLGKAILQYQRSLEIRRELGDLPLIASAYLNIGNLYYQNNDLDKAIETYLIGQGILKDSVDQEFIVVSIKLENKLGNVYKEKGEWVQAGLYFNQALTHAQESNDERAIANVQLSLGSLYREQEHFPQALEAYFAALNSYKKIKSSRDIAKANHNIGNVYLQQGLYDKALEYLLRSIRQKEALNQQDTYRSYQSIGSIYETQLKLDSALYYFNLSLNIELQSGIDEANLVDPHINLGNIYLLKKQYSQALDHFLSALENGTKSGQLYHIAALNGKTAEAYSGLNQFDKAYEFAQRENQLSDSLESEYRRLVVLQDQLETERQKNVLAEQVRLLETSKAEKNLLYTQAVAAVLLLSSIGFFLLYRNKKLQSKKELAEQQQQMYALEIDDMLHTQELRSTQDRFEGQELERKRMAKELHDHLGSMLSTVKLYFKVFDKKLHVLEEPLQAQYLKANQLLDEACGEVRKISHNLESGGVKEFGLVKQLATMAQNIEESKLIKVFLHVHGLTDRLGLQMETNIYRIVQELVANVLKHAKATEVTVQLNRLNGTLNLIVEDNGVGFTKENLISPAAGIGLNNVFERVKSMNGTTVLDSGRGGGTTVSIDLPLSTSL